MASGASRTRRSARCSAWGSLLPPGSCLQGRVGRGNRCSTYAAEPMATVPERMAAAVLQGPGRLEIAEVDVPALGPTDVLVEVDRCGVCGSDLHMVLEGWGKPGSIPGHEWTGVVAAVGSDVDRWRAGDAVVGGPTVRCGVCPACVAGRPSLCDRARHARHRRVTRRVRASTCARRPTSFWRCPTTSIPAPAALTEPLAVALHGITQSRRRARASRRSSWARDRSVR